MLLTTDYSILDQYRDGKTYAVFEYIIAEYTFAYDINNELWSVSDLMELNSDSSEQITYYTDAEFLSIYQGWMNDGYSIGIEEVKEEGV
jgi:hypothetical protein